jgi:hypothetical protein
MECCRLAKYASLFDEHHVTFDDFLGLTAEHLEDMGIVTFGAKRRIMRAVIELRVSAPQPCFLFKMAVTPHCPVACLFDCSWRQHALAADDDDEFVPPEYEGDSIDLEPGFYKHEADYLHVLEGIPVGGSAS